MSTKALTWAFEQKVGSAPRKAVLISLADQANDETFVCYPSQATIAKRTELADRTVRRELAVLESDGFVVREARFDAKGHRSSDQYRLAVEVTIGKHQRPKRPPATVATGQSDHRSEMQRPPATQAYPTGHSGQVTRREPEDEPEDAAVPAASALKVDDETAPIASSEPLETQPSTPLSDNRRAQLLAKHYVDLVPMAKFPAVLGICKVAIGRAGYSDDEVKDALTRLASEGRTVTVETMRLELEGMPAHRSSNRRNPEPISGAEAYRRARQAERQFQ